MKLALSLWSSQPHYLLPLFEFSELLCYVSGLCFTTVLSPNQTQANVVCVVYDVTDEDTINKVKTRKQASVNVASQLPQGPESVTFCLVR